MSATDRFDFEFDARYRRAARPFGIAPSSAWAEVDGTQLRARYGPWRVVTPLANVTDVAVTGPYAFLKTAGPARLGVTDRGLTFASNGARGVRVSFREPVRSAGPFGFLRHPELTVTVREVERFASLLRALIERS